MAQWASYFSKFTYFRGSGVQLLELLKPENRETVELEKHFVECYHGKIHTCNFFETQGSKIGRLALSPVSIYQFLNFYRESKPSTRDLLPFYAGLQAVHDLLIKFTQTVARPSNSMPGATFVSMNSDHTYLVKFPSIDHPDYLRVTREIRKVVNSHSKKNVSPPAMKGQIQNVGVVEGSSADYRVNFETIGLPVCPRFIGREIELETMRRYLLPVESAKRAKRLVIHGLGGMGKTQLALQYAIERSDSYSAFLWVSSKSERDLQDGIAKFAERIPLPQVLDKSGSLLAGAASKKEAWHLVLEWMSLPGNSKWLMVLDNADDQLFTKTGKSQNGNDHSDAWRYFPHQGTVIITTRLSDLKAFGQSIEIERVPMQDGLELLCSASDTSIDDDGKRL